MRAASVPIIIKTRTLAVCEEALPPVKTVGVLLVFGDVEGGSDVEAEGFVELAGHRLELLAVMTVTVFAVEGEEEMDHLVNHDVTKLTRREIIVVGHGDAGGINAFVEPPSLGVFEVSACTWTVKLGELRDGELAVEVFLVTLTKGVIHGDEICYHILCFDGFLYKYDEMRTKRPPFHTYK